MKTKVTGERKSQINKKNKTEHFKQLGQDKGKYMTTMIKTQLETEQLNKVM